MNGGQLESGCREERAVKTSRTLPSTPNATTAVFYGSLKRTSTNIFPSSFLDRNTQTKLTKRLQPTRLSAKETWLQPRSRPLYLVYFP